MVLISFSVLLISLLVSLSLTPVVRNYVISRGILDVPVDDRRIHILPVPRLGGVALFLTFLLVSLATPFISRLSFFGFFGFLGSIYSYCWILKLLLPISLMFLIGLIDFC